MASISFYSVLVLTTFNLFGYLHARSITDLVLYLILIPVALFAIWRISNLLAYQRIVVSDLLIFLLFMLFGISLSIQSVYIVSLTDLFGINTYDYAKSTVVIGALWLLAGAACSFYRTGSNLLLSFIVIAPIVIIVIPTLNENYVVNYAELIEGTNDRRANHLKVADFLIINLAFAYIVAGKFRFAVFVLIGLILFTLGGRTALYISLLSIVFFELLFNKHRAILTFLLVSITVTSLFYFTNFHDNIDQESNLVARMLFIDGVEEDDSFQGRIVANQTGYSALLSQSLYGDSAFSTRTMGGVGDYIHNLLSAWQSYGAAVFFLLVYLLFISLVRMYKARLNACVMQKTTAIVLIYTSIAVITSKAVNFKLLWFCIGYWVLGYGVRRIHQEFSFSSIYTSWIQLARNITGKDDTHHATFESGLRKKKKKKRRKKKNKHDVPTYK